MAIATPDGQSISYAYDAKGYLASVTYPGGGQRQYSTWREENIANTSYYGR
ncbi:MAG: RHS repeat protein [Betaproteobacteria bacterium]|nr:RHS repeat protein [Betaproteobacteria bacterium]